jgi:hypothetical protein
MNGNGQGRAKGKEPVERVVDLFVHMPIGFAVMAWKRVPDFVVSVPDLVTQALSKGCAQITEVEGRVSEEVRKARMIGQVAVTFGGRQVRREVDARLADALRKAGGVASFIPGVGADGGSNGAGARPGGVPLSATAAPQAPATKPPATSTTKTTEAPGTAETPRKATAGKATAGKATGAKATGATKATRAKAPAKAASTGAATAAPPGTAAELPIREYDGLSASQVVSRLTGLTPGELRAVRAYEAASRGRRTIVLAIDRLLT